MVKPALTPELALAYLQELSTDIRAAVLLDGRGELAASSEEDPERSERIRELVLDLLARVDEAAAEPPPQLEVSTGEGAVFCVRRPEWTLAAVTGRFALSSLMFYDLRSVLDDLEPAPA